MPKVYQVYVEWVMTAVVEQEADSLDEAVDLVRSGTVSNLPADAEYCSGSFEADYENSVHLNEAP